jgi:2-amino-4-hydroxy-6-hydroxymethyldihydropteridine diphosphokinase
MNAHIAYLGFGSNLGDSLSTLRQSHQILETNPKTRVTSTSPLYRTTPVGGPPNQPDYLNGVMEIDTTLEPLELLHFCQTIEESFGRKRTVRWDARTLDIDLLLFADRVITSVELQLPHPRMSERGFVLHPLCDLAADFIHPKLHCTLTTLLTQISPLQGVHRLDEVW